ncbi:DNA-binding response OmpR family regulator [Symbiobacterium terraclitae]|uniref:Stage 0 sporulation protein A homolog n=1 Tax=Symbiobacterium terraclitae TaxID=557451 RepID=A0ABS4JSS5_9FIRM|nr:response regulator transcription factor [Symbiobacterium terraclitae]MBP2018599.1 DNA-binding response OmpR family regulator [Symbiobacterium terraclitae]
MAEPLILVVDDEQAIADLIEIHLLSEGYRVRKADNGADALRIVAEEQPDLVILDIMMPGMDGLEVCRAIRRERNVPILMLSAKSEDVDKILGLKTGADDYLTKPFNPLELMARVKAQLRRYLALNPASARRPDVIAVGGLQIDRESRTVTKDGREVALTPTEYDILLLLASNPGRVFSSEEIFERVWKERYFQANNTVMVHIRRLREKVEDDPSHPTLIRTVWGVGYKIEN